MFPESVISRTSFKAAAAAASATAGTGETCADWQLLVLLDLDFVLVVVLMLFVLLLTDLLVKSAQGRWHRWQMFRRLSFSASCNTKVQDQTHNYNSKFMVLSSINQLK